MVDDIVTFAYVPNDRKDRYVMTRMNGREEVMDRLRVESDAHPIPKNRLIRVINRGHHLMLPIVAITVFEGVLVQMTHLAEAGK